MSRGLRIACVGGGPAGLYFALLMKRTDPRHEIRVIERNRPDDTFGFGVVFSDATMAGVAVADAELFKAISNHLVHWDDIEIHCPGDAETDQPAPWLRRAAEASAKAEVSTLGAIGSPLAERRGFRPGVANTVITSTGHGFSGMGRHTLLHVLQEQARDAGIEMVFGREVHDLSELAGADLVVGADGVNSTIRSLLGDRTRTQIDLRPNRFTWMGTTKPFSAFTFYFRADEHGLWRVHAYQYGPDRSTFIVECRDETWRAAGMDRATEAESARYLETLFAEELAGHPLICNRSLWRQFPTVRVSPWSSGNVVLLGDAAHTAHFSVGSGTRMAMEDAAALRDAIVAATADDLGMKDALGRALAAYEAGR